MTRRHLHLNAFLHTVGHHESAWRLPESARGAATDVQHYVELTQIAERGKFDSVFFADGPSLQGDVRYRPTAWLDPTVLLPVLAAATRQIGLVATASTTYNEPYNLARKFASIDLISGGRAGWNIVTTAGLDAARNFGLDAVPAHALRYERAAEFVEVCLKLWDSWERDFVIDDRATGQYADGSKIHTIDHRGTHFRVRGPLNVPSSAQGRPLLVQAGSSDDGKALAARYAEAVFTAQYTLADGQAFYADLKAQAKKVGRNPDHVKVLPGLVAVIGSTESEAKEREDELARLQVWAYGLRQLSQMLGREITEAQLDERLPAELGDVRHVQTAQSRFALISELAQREQLTVRELLIKMGGGRGHRTFAGTPEQVADTIEEWFNSGAADGFNVMPPVFKRDLALFVDHVVPILQKRGLFREDYTTSTLRDHYGLPTHENRFTRERESSAAQ